MMQYVAVLSLIATAFDVPTNAAPVPSSDTTSEVTELRGLVKDLQQQVNELKAAGTDRWLTDQRAAEIRSVVQDVLADADTRASLLESGTMAGYDKGFFIASGDGNFLLRIGGQLQVRYVYNHRNDPPTNPPPADPGDEYRQGFEIRRAKLLLKGHIFDPTWTYDVQLAADRNTGTMQLEDQAWIQKDLGEGWKVKAGQTKAPYLLEEIWSSQRLLAVERSLFNSFFTAGTVQGVQVAYDAEKWRAFGMYYDGARSANTGWQVPDTEWGAVGGRFEYLFAGEWKQMNDYDGWRGQGTAFMVGVASNYQKGEYGTTATDPEVGNFGLTVDATAKFNGWSLSGAFAYRNLDPNGPGAAADQYGFYAQGGVFLSDSIELYARYEWADADMASTPNNLSVATLGVTKFWDKHNLKWQTDIGYGFDPVDSAFAQSSAGWLPDSPNEDGQIVIRSQLQLLF
jgi:hypothetical protein